MSKQSLSEKLKRAAEESRVWNEGPSPTALLRWADEAAALEARVAELELRIKTLQLGLPQHKDMTFAEALKHGK